MITNDLPVRALNLPKHQVKLSPIVWLGQSVRTTIVTKRYPSLAGACWMASLGDAVHRPQLVDRVFCGDLKERLAVRGPVMLDSGGFTMMMQNRGLHVSEVARIYGRTRAELCISLDVPTIRRDRKQTRIRKYQQTRENLAHLVRCVDPGKIVPVVHGMSITEVVNNCEAIGGITPRPPMICIGGLVPLLRRMGRESVQRYRAFTWIASIISTVRNHFPTALIHILGAGSPQTVAATIRCGADSTDSLAWRRAAGFGTIFLPGTAERFLQPRERQRATSRPVLNAREVEVLAQCTCPACSETDDIDARISDLAKSYLARAAHNACVILREAEVAAAARMHSMISAQSSSERASGAGV
jgi:queuine/archaeosine tRNA-ribosyltransferase